MEVTQTVDKMRENCLRWFGHLDRRPIDATIRRTDFLEVTGTSGLRGRPKNTWIETVRNDLRKST